MVALKLFPPTIWDDQHMFVLNGRFWVGTHLVDVRRRNLTGRNERIEALHDELSALEADEGTGRSTQG
jgi:hypothetical protein